MLDINITGDMVACPGVWSVRLINESLPIVRNRALVRAVAHNQLHRVMFWRVSRREATYRRSGVWCWSLKTSPSFSWP